MKYILKIFLNLILTLIFNISFSQNKYDTKYLKEIKLIFKNSANQKFDRVFLNFDDTYNLPEYLSCYKEYIDNQKKTKSKESWFYFDTSYADILKLNKSDIDEIKLFILNDTNRFQIQKKWFVKNKIKIIPDSLSKIKKYTTEFMKPIFFRNYTRCFIAISGKNYLDSFFLKKINGKWVFDKSYIMIDYD